MGKKWNRKRKAEEKRRKAAENKANNEEDDRNNEKKSYRPFVPTNAKMEAYYAYQNLHNTQYDPSTKTFVPCTTMEEKEEERTKWITSMRAILPASFRIARDMNDEDDSLRVGIEKELEEFVGKEIEIVVDKEEGRGWNGPPIAKDTTAAATKEENKNMKEDKGKKEEGKDNAEEKNTKEDDDNVTTKKEEEKEKKDETTDNKPNNNNNNNNNNNENLIKKLVAPAKPIPFVPHGYQLSLDRRTIRRNPSLQKFHDWLKIHTNAGFITRQETVSMIPPIVLNPQPHHAVLDMCAAPGSKTCQLLEAVAGMDKGELEPSGFVVANDADPKRAYMLVHQLRRMNSPAVFVCACDAQFYPTLKKREEEKKEVADLEGTFDRVLCDVPCSGDGTARKNPGIWRHWNQMGALALHPLQLSIALNGARQTKVGGYMCYSTCSMNPVENEAVVAEILRSTDGSLELVDRRPELEQLHARPGWTSWRVMKEERKRSRKDEKNYRKKNSPKMQQRRKEWEEKRKKEEEEKAKKEGGKKTDEEEKMDVDTANGESEEKDEEKEKIEANDADKMVEGESTDQKEKVEKSSEGVVDGKTTSNGNDQTNKDDDTSKNEPETTTWNPRVEYTPPPSWDEETLRARAKAEGLIEFATFDDVPPEWKRKVRASIFPPTPEEIEKFNLHKCMRCLPHDMDTGGFFVALFKKVAPMSARAKEKARKLALESRPDVVDNEKGGESSIEPEVKKAKVENAEKQELTADAAVEDSKNSDGDVVMTDSCTSAIGTDEKESEVESTVETDKDDRSTNVKDENKENDEDEKVTKAPKGKPLHRGKGKTRGDLGNEDYIPIDNERWAPMVKFYGLSSSFPREQYMARSAGESKVFYFISNAIKTQLIDRGLQKRVTVINSGLKGFERNSKECEVNYRITQEGIQFLAPHMEKRKVVANLDDFSKCIGTGAIKLENFSDEFQKQVSPLSFGSFCVALEGYENDVAKKMFLVMWKCRGDNMNCLVGKMEMDGMKSKLRKLSNEGKQTQSDMEIDKEKNGSKDEVSNEDT